MRIMFDLDGVLRNFDGSWRRKFAEYFNVSMPPPSPYWTYMMDMLESKGVPRDDTFDFYFKEHGYDITSKAEPFDDAYGSVAMLQFLGHHIIIATDQPTIQTRLGTLQWLHDQAIIPDELVFTKDKTLIHANWYIDDKQENLIHLNGLRLAVPGVKVVGINRPYNDLDNLQGIRQVETASDYVELIRRWCNDNGYYGDRVPTS